MLAGRDYPPGGIYVFMIKLRTHKGQAILPEHVITFFVLMGAIIAMSAYVQRALQARTRDARNFAMDMAAQGCSSVGSGCLAAAGGAVVNGTFVKEYEPYYGRSTSIVTRTQDAQKGMVGGDFVRNTTDQTQVVTQSGQLPPQDAR